MFSHIGFRCNIWRVGNRVFLELENIRSLQICRNKDMVGDCFGSQLQTSLFFSGVDVILVAIKVFQALEAEMIAIPFRTSDHCAVLVSCSVHPHAKNPYKL